MMDYRALMRWDAFVTPSLIRTFYALCVGFFVVLGLIGVLSSLATMAISPFTGFLGIIASLIWVTLGVVGSRVVAETVLILFRINEHLGAIRDQRR